MLGTVGDRRMNGLDLLSECEVIVPVFVILWMVCRSLVLYRVGSQVGTGLYDTELTQEQERCPKCRCSIRLAIVQKTASTSVRPCQENLFKGQSRVLLSMMGVVPRNQTVIIDTQRKDDTSTNACCLNVDSRNCRNGACRKFQDTMLACLHS